MPSIFEGLKVLDLTRVIAGPLCTQHLADMGATVYKIEKPGEGDDTRRMGSVPERAGHTSATFVAYNRGKQSITLDIATPEGAALVRDLVTRCDVLVENYKVGTLARYGLDEASLRPLKPDLIYCSVTGFGQSGPYAARPAYDFILQGMAGAMSTCGQPEGTPGGEPMRTSIPITDVVTGLHATIAIVSALYHRLRTGEGQFLDMAMIDAAVALNGHLAQGYLMTGQSPTHVGNSNPIAAPSEVFQSADVRLIVAAGNNGQFVALCKVLGLDVLITDPRFVTNVARIANRKELHKLLNRAMAHRPGAELLDALAAAGVPAGPIQNMAQVFADPQTRHRELHLDVPYGDGQAVPAVRNPLRYSATPVVHRPAPLLGEHSAQVLSDELGLDAHALAGLRARGIV